MPTIDVRDAYTLLLHDAYEAHGWEGSAMRWRPSTGLLGHLRRAVAAVLDGVRDMWESL